MSDAGPAIDAAAPNLEAAVGRAALALLKGCQLHQPGAAAESVLDLLAPALPLKPADAAEAGHLGGDSQEVMAAAELLAERLACGSARGARGNVLDGLLCVLQAAAARVDEAGAGGAAPEAATGVAAAHVAGHAFVRLFGRWAAECQAAIPAWEEAGATVAGRASGREGEEESCSEGAEEEEEEEAESLLVNLLGAPQQFIAAAAALGSYTLLRAMRLALQYVTLGGLGL